MSSTTGKVAKCWNCGRLYRIYAHMVGDQSVCRRCRAEADREVDPK